MPEKFRKGGKTVEEMLEGIVELAGWQVELARAALREVRQAPAKGRRRGGPGAKAAPRRGK